MTNRFRNIPGFSIDSVAAAAAEDPGILRLENLDTDLRPPPAAIEATRRALDDDDANSYLPFTGSLDLRAAVARKLEAQSGIHYAAEQVVITCGGTEGMLDALFATTVQGDEVIVTDPSYAGMIQRVRLAGTSPRFVPFRQTEGQWRLDIDALRKLVVWPFTRAMFLMNPSIPAGAVFNDEEWQAVADFCCTHNLWLLYNAAMERILFHDVPYRHPASLPGMAERTVIIGSISKEYRMIGWRVGWVAGPPSIMENLAKAHIYNVVTPVGIAQAGALAALTTPDDGLSAALAEWQARHDTVVNELEGLPVTPAAGGWSLLLDTLKMGHTATTASRLLLEKARVAATPMNAWGDRNSGQFVRLVFSNEPVDRLRGLSDRVRRALLR